MSDTEAARQSFLALAPLPWTWFFPLVFDRDRPSLGEVGVREVELEGELFAADGVEVAADDHCEEVEERGLAAAVLAEEDVDAIGEAQLGAGLDVAIAVDFETLELGERGV